MKVLICGDRNYNDVDIIGDFIYSLPKDTIIIEGEAKGADSLARDAAIKLGLQVERYPAQWGLYGRKAGVLRNLQQLQEGKPDYVVGYHNNVKSSKGTKNMLSISIKAGVPTYLNLVDFLDIELGLAKRLSLEDLEEQKETLF